VNFKHHYSLGISGQFGFHSKYGILNVLHPLQYSKVPGYNLTSLLYWTLKGLVASYWYFIVPDLKKKVRNMHFVRMTVLIVK